MAQGVVRDRVFGRGDLVVVHIELPNRRGLSGTLGKPKWVVLLHDERAYRGSDDVAVVVASTWRRGDAPIAPYEVLCEHGDGFAVPSVIDCRWPFTLLKSEVRAGTHKATLTEARMDDIAVALTVGLSL